MNSGLRLFGTMVAIILDGMVIIGSANPITVAVAAVSMVFLIIYLSFVIAL